MTDRAAILARVSTAEQATDDRHSLHVQDAMTRRFVEIRGWELARVFAIKGESAYRDDLKDRPEFAAAIAEGLAGAFDHLVVYDLSRFARNQAVLHDTLRSLRRAGVHVWGAVNGIDYTEQPEWAGLEGIFAERASSEHSRRVAHAYARRHERGLPTGDLPFGYRSRGTDVPAEIVPDEAAAIRWAFEEHADGMGYHEIAAEFNRRGLRPRSKRGYEGFVPSSVQRLVENRFYAGFVTHKGHEGRGAHEPIVSEDLFARSMASIRRFRKGTRTDMLLTGIARCMACGGPLWSSGHDRQREGRYYREPSHLQMRECPNARTAWHQSAPDDAVSAAMRALLVGRDWLAFVKREARRVRTDGNGEAARAAVQEERRRLGLLMKRGIIGEAEWLREDEALAARLSAECPPQVSEILLAAQEVTRFADIWEGATMEERREAVRLVLRFVELDTRSKDVAAGVRMHPQARYRGLFEWRSVFAGYTPERTRSLFQQTGFTLLDLGAA